VWRKAQDSKLESSSGASLSSVSTAQHPPNTPPPVSQGIKIKGEISGHGDLFLDGEFEGKIRIDSGTLTVGPNARVRAEIEATEIVVRGDVIGTLKASERVHIWSTGKITGNIETRGIVIDDGAVLCGTVAVPQGLVREGTAPEVSLSERDHLPQPARPEPPPLAKKAST
jgi:cytoskeletal protein CcmA (bactofilin family)